MKNHSYSSVFLACLSLLGLNTEVRAQVVINDTLNGASSSFNWQALNGACLTAGNNTGTIPACVGLPYYAGKTQVGGTTGRLPDVAGAGALRLTNGDIASGGVNGNSQTGAVVSNFTFPTNAGLQVSFTTVSYGGNNNKSTGADGIGFYLMDGSQAPNVGALGGSLGYSCSNSNTRYDGLSGGYLGVGIDEYGNFSSAADNTNTGAGVKAGRISLRGSGDTNWASLTSRYLKYYPTASTAANKKLATEATCKTGKLQNWGVNQKDATGAMIVTYSSTNEKLAYNYPLMAYSDLPATVKMSNQQGFPSPKRGVATPITYALKITQDGILDLSYSLNGGSSQQIISNKNVATSNGPVPGSFRFGFSSSTGAGSNVHEITCFKAAPVEESSSSAGTNVQQSARVEAGSQVYLAYFHPQNSWGELSAQTLLYDPVTDLVSIKSVPNWNANCGLTGGLCASTGVTSVAQSPGTRKILTQDGTSGVPFQWSNITLPQQTTLTAGDAVSNDSRLRYLRGDRTDEVSAGGVLRSRSGVLGDIVNSSPTWVGPPSAPYLDTWGDAIHSTAMAYESVYSAFKATYATRQNIVYVGANDGLMHGFKAGSFNAAGDTFVSDATTPNDGAEALAYVPNAVLNSIHSTTSSLDFSSPQYSHNLYTDATPETGDLFYAGAWHTWLVSGLGGGGNVTGPVGTKTAVSTGSIFALDITDPTTFAESNAGNQVIGDWSSSSIVCVNVASCGAYLGNTYGTPSIRRLHNGNWAVLFGNGLNSSKGTAGLFIMLVDAVTGATTFRYIDTGSGAVALNKNGIAYVTPADLDGDHITDYVYAGDVMGNLWRFDLTSTSPASWSVSATPMIALGATQPIATKVVVGSVPGVGAAAKPRVIVAFGTGQQLPQTLTAGAVYAAGAQALYGVWDWNMNAWNLLSGATAKYESLTGPQTVNVAALLAQSVTSVVPGTGVISNYRTVSTSKVCWSGSSVCTSGNTRFGWTLPLPTSTEQVIYNPIIGYGMFIVNTLVPSVSSPLTCDKQSAAGYTMAVTLGGGGAAKQSFFGNVNNDYVNYNGEIVSGIGLNATGSPSIVTAHKKPYLVQQTVSGVGVVTQVNPGAAGIGGRLNWMRVR